MTASPTRASRFTDYYAQQSCTAGRAAFISGSVPVRSGMTKVGLPGAEQGWQATDLTMATVLKSLGYATGQFGKNHQGDRDEHLPTMHGFDEFFGNLYHLNAQEEPEQPRLPGRQVLADGRTFSETFGPRGVIHSWANPDGSQRIEDTGPLTRADGDGGRGDRWQRPSASSPTPSRPARRSSSGGMAPACTSAPI